ncbi:AtpZ/AtpI family protein [Salisediminibacterium halotolerans]|uniref:AtpZ/AtpI family protein n=1 Tax=Salisediminibacterium halotolerans TaxID=517425 RepID=UPI000EAEF389|nr:AtpZ/AtpI family protein [Salisediminibacterium halotolerans]RLJ75803.1 putative F0F1-ATPase subunit (Ca2+/Mg2+ transporter) [Actinophytocola xinjiangensis]RPE89657.1 putative F0F1-ATPase subunit (Ca2+/Mg2+ transporter) [Salisediminibacterium halotolerans]TWG36416.1 putative F0F1-ATPase subunit (Ca2+/Mg2+ transporter) [Salisediminibacterium halotolerans]GEL08977.1 hypothetical protein SHA02_23930 [Salisediminibacterium halotolerans]
MSEPSKYRSLMKAFALMSTISAYFIGSVVIGVIVGNWLENRYETGGLFLVGGMLLGLATAVFGIYRAIRQYMEDGDDSS